MEGSALETEDSVLTVFSPENGQHLSGIQQLRAAVEGMPVNAYTTFWRVDGGVWNSMADGTPSGLHKISYIDVSYWNWNASKTYTIEFIAKYPDGKVIANESRTVQVMN